MAFNIVWYMYTWWDIYLYMFIYLWRVKVKGKVAQSCLTHCDVTDYTVHVILQARILEWVAVSFSRASSQPRYRIHVSCIAGGFFTSRATREVYKYHEFTWNFQFQFNKGINSSSFPSNIWKSFLTQKLNSNYFILTYLISLPLGSLIYSKLHLLE